MLKNYLKIAFRNLIKNKVSSFINIGGLAMGMAVAMLIGIWVWDEVSFDASHSHRDRLARLMSTTTFNGQTSTGEGIAVPLAKELQGKYPGDFKNMALASDNQRHILTIGDKNLSQPGRWVQPAFPFMFTLKMIKGSADALKDPSSILLTESLANILFDNADPINQTIRIDNTFELKVTGVYKDLPLNSTFSYTKYLLPWDNKENKSSTLTDWNNHHNQLFVQMSDAASFTKTTEKIKSITRPHIKGGTYEEVFLHPMNKWYLYNEFKNGKSAGGRIDQVWLFGIIGIFVLLLACINFMNLSTARSEKRAKEAGIRKAIGSLRSQLVSQFLCESLTVASLGSLLALALVQLSLPFFNELAGKQMILPWGNPVFWILVIIFTAFTGLIAGSYPAFYLSAFKPVKVLKGTFKAGRFASLPRKALVTVQFTVSIALIICTIIVFRQIQFAKNRPAGYNRDRLVTMAITTPELQGHYDAIRNDLLQTNVIENMAESSSPSTNVVNHMLGFDWKGRDPASVPLIGTIGVTHDFGKTIGWTIKEGRDFSRDFPADTGSLILNEAAVRLTGFTHPIGEIMKWRGKDRIITGVVKDMVMESPYAPVQPVVFVLDYGWTKYMTMRIKPTLTEQEALSKIEPVLKKYSPENPFYFSFTEEAHDGKFYNEERMGKLATFFAVLAILISCLGLFGLASFVAEQRTKEIGVRKVLGASVFDLWRLLSKDFAMLVILSLIIATPIAYYFMHSWLQNFQYRSEIVWWIFAITGFGAMIITLLTISYQGIKAALKNPVKSLRTE